MKQIRVLYVLSDTMYRGGTEAFIMNYYRHIDKNRVQIDFIYQGDEVGVYDTELLSGGSRIYHIPFKTKHPIQFTKMIARIIKEGQYKIVHSQMDAMGVWPLSIAWYCGVPMRIAHSHNTYYQTKNPVKKMCNFFAKLLLRKCATDFYACGYEAGVFMFGKRRMAEGDALVIHNAIDLQHYQYSDNERKTIREEFGITDEIIIGHVGQFREQKNHRKIVEVFAELAKFDNKYKLMLVGDGPLRKEIETMVKQMKLESQVIFTGARGDVSSLLSAFDVFLFPSLFEGLSIVAIEAQANGLPCVFSDTIAEETDLTNLVFRVNLMDDANSWCEVLKNALKSGRKDETEEIRRRGYDISIEAKKLENRYYYAVK